MLLLPNVFFRSFTVKSSVPLLIRQSSFASNSTLPKKGLYHATFRISLKKYLRTQSPSSFLSSLYRVPNIRNVIPRSGRTNFGNTQLFKPNHFNFFGTNASKKNTGNEWEELLKLPLMKRMHVMFKKYWYIAVPFHCVNSLLWFGGSFLLAKCGVNGAQIINWIKPYIVEWEYCPSYVKEILEKDADKLGTLAVAVLLYKLLTPGRYATTVFGTIYLLRYLLKRGVLVKSAGEQLKSVKSSYITHAVSKNIEKQKDRMKSKIQNSKKHK